VGHQRAASKDDACSFFEFFHFCKHYLDNVPFPITNKILPSLQFFLARFGWAPNNLT
jgi:hypothetical protein